MAKKIKSKLLYTSSDWSLESIDKVYKEIEKIAIRDLGCDLYPMNIEIISSDQMLDCYSSHGLPIHYHHWSFGKRHLVDESQYKRGTTGLAYEIIINTNPSIAYLMENNTQTMQTLVLAHVMGHNHFFKNNYLFKQWTQADAIIDYMKFAKEFILRCEEKYGQREVEEILDACHALQFNGVDRYKRPAKLSRQRQLELHKQRLKYAEEFEDEIWKMIPKKEEYDTPVEQGTLADLEENLLYFIEKHSPTLRPWQKEIVRIVRKINQYFWPQMQTQVMNEGFACFTHYHIMNKMYDEGFISESNMLEFFDNHSGVIFQTTPDFRTEEEKKADSLRGRRKPGYNGINPYALGFAMMQDIKRICENPTEEDKEWFPDLAGADWKSTIIGIVEDYRDESFIRQFLSPKVIRDFKFLQINNSEEDTDNSTIANIHNGTGYKNIRNALADSYDINLRIPNIQVYKADMTGDRKLGLRHYSVKNRLLQENVYEVLPHIKTLWGYSVSLDSLDENGDIQENYDTDEF